MNEYEMQNSGFICSQIQNILSECIYDYEKTSLFMEYIKKPWNFFKDLIFKKEEEKEKIKKLLKMDIGDIDSINSDTYINNNYSFIPYYYGSIFYSLQDDRDKAKKYIEKSNELIEAEMTRISQIYNLLVDKYNITANYFYEKYIFYFNIQEQIIKKTLETLEKEEISIRIKKNNIEEFFSIKKNKYVEEMKLKGFNTIFVLYEKPSFIKTCKLLGSEFANLFKGIKSCNKETIINGAKGILNTIKGLFGNDFKIEIDEEELKKKVKNMTNFQKFRESIFGEKYVKRPFYEEMNIKKGKNKLNEYIDIINNIIYQNKIQTNIENLKNTTIEEKYIKEEEIEKNNKILKEELGKAIDEFLKNDKNYQKLQNIMKLIKEKGGEDFFYEANKELEIFIRDIYDNINNDDYFEKNKDKELFENDIKEYTEDRKKKIQEILRNKMKEFMMKNFKEYEILIKLKIYDDIYKNKINEIIEDLSKNKEKEKEYVKEINEKINQHNIYVEYCNSYNEEKNKIKEEINKFKEDNNENIDKNDIEKKYNYFKSKLEEIEKKYFGEKSKEEYIEEIKNLENELQELEKKYDQIKKENNNNEQKLNDINKDYEKDTEKIKYGESRGQEKKNRREEEINNENITGEQQVNNENRREEGMNNEERREGEINNENIIILKIKYLNIYFIFYKLIKK